MALIKLGAIITAISGKVGGQTFVKSSRGNALRNNGVLVNKSTVRQIAVRLRCATTSRLWRTLTSAEKGTFTGGVLDYPYTNRLGEVAYYSGFNLFQLLTNQTLAYDNSYNTSLPPFQAIIGASLVVKDSDFDKLFLEVFNSYSPLMSYQIYATPNLSNGIQNPEKYFKRIAFVGASASSTLSYASNYTQIFGSLDPGNIIFIGMKVTTISTGLNETFYSTITKVLITG